MITTSYRLDVYKHIPNLKSKYMTTLCKVDKFRHCLYVSCIKYHEGMAYERAFYYAKKGGLYGQ